MAIEQQQTEQQPQQQPLSQSSSSNSSLTNSISLVKLDELSSFGATKQSRLPALIRLEQVNSMPTFSGQQLEQSEQQQHQDQQQTSLPPNLTRSMDKENTIEGNPEDRQQQDDDGDFQVLDMGSSELVGPSLPAQSQQQAKQQQEEAIKHALAASSQINQQPQSALLGDSLIEMIINLRNENQNLVRALETNNEYVKERINEFKRFSEESKRREAQFAIEKADYEHQARKLQRQNLVLSERLKSMEAKLKDMKLEVSESLAAAHSSKASSVNQEQQQPGNSSLYPTLTEAESFANSALNEQQQQQPTMQMDATDEDTQRPMETSECREARREQEGEETEAKRIGSMTKDELSKRFDANKAEFYSLSEDPMKQCDKLEQQLNDIGKRDYEICLLQQQLNIYRQDYRLERMANLEAKIQIEKLRSDIDRLCYERLQERSKQAEASSTAAAGTSGGRHRRGFEAADAVIGRLGQQLGRKAAKTAAKAAKYAAKQAHREEKAQAIATARATAAAAATTAAATAPPAEQPATGSEAYHHHHKRHHARHHRSGSGSGAVSGLRAVRSEVVNDLLSTANKAMLTGYKMASTHVNLALDKLSQYEQAQANNLAQNKDVRPSAPQMGPPSID